MVLKLCISTHALTVIPCLKACELPEHDTHTSELLSPRKLPDGHGTQVLALDWLGWKPRAHATRWQLSKLRPTTLGHTQVSHATDPLRAAKVLPAHRAQDEALRTLLNVPAGQGVLAVRPALSV